MLALNGIAMVNVGEKFVKAVPEAAGNTAGAPFDTNSAANLPELGQYVTHVVQLKYAKPSELVPILQPFSKIPNAILPIEGTQMLVLRDYAENVKRMLELVDQIDVAIPSEFVSEVIPIKYAKASDIASALNSLSTGGGGHDVGDGHRRHPGGTRSTGVGPDRRHWRRRWLSGANDDPGNGHPARRSRHADSCAAATRSRSASRTSSSAPAPAARAKFRSWVRPRSSRTSAPIRC